MQGSCTGPASSCPFGYPPAHQPPAHQFVEAPASDTVALWPAAASGGLNETVGGLCGVP